MRKSIILSCIAVCAALTGCNCKSNSCNANVADTDSTASVAVAPVVADSTADNLALGKKFLAQNATRKGVTTTQSGLQYEVVTKGKGKKPTKDNQVTVHYTGKLIDGTVFDSSVERGEPITFALSQVIPGWTEALQLMSEGSEWNIYIPSELAYGNKEMAGVIPANSTLIFNVKLIKVL